MDTNYNNLLVSKTKTGLRALGLLMLPAVLFGLYRTLIIEPNYLAAASVVLMQLAVLWIGWSPRLSLQQRQVYTAMLAYYMSLHLLVRLEDLSLAFVSAVLAGMLLSFDAKGRNMSWLSFSGVALLGLLSQWFTDIAPHRAALETFASAGVMWVVSSIARALTLESLEKSEALQEAYQKLVHRDAELMRIQEQQQILSRDAGIAFFEYDASTGLLDGDATLQRMFGRNEGDGPFVSASYVDAWNADDKKVMAQANKVLAKLPERTSHEWSHSQRLPDGSISKRRVVGFNSTDRGQSLFYGASIDVTKEVNALEQSRDMASTLARQHAKEAKMYAVIGHELRTPAASLKMMLNEIDQGDQLDLSLARANIEQLLSVVDMLRSVAQPDLMLVAEPVAVSLNELVSAPVLSLQKIAERADIHLSFECSELGDERLMVKDNLLKQVLTNLIKNALIHSGAKNVRVALSVRKLDEARCAVEILIADDGQGIAPDKVEGLFGAFVRGESVAEGTGLGLFVCREIVTSMDGRLSYQSASGGGAEFKVELEFNCVEQRVPEPVAAKANYWSGKRILLAEDNKTLQLLAQQTFRKRGADVRVADNGVEALSEYEAGVFDLILTDIFMPQMDGYEFVEALRARGCSLPIVGLTAATIGNETEKMRSCGVLEVLSKPLDIHKLEAVLSLKL